MKFVIFNSDGTIREVLDKVYTVHIGSGKYHSYINKNWDSGRPIITTQIAYSASKNVIFRCEDEFNEFVDCFVSDDSGLSSRRHREYNFVEYKPHINKSFEYVELKENEYHSYNGVRVNRCKYYTMKGVVCKDELIRMINLFEGKYLKQLQPNSSHVITADQLRTEFNNVVQRYYAECDSNGGHEGTVKSHKYSAIADFIQEIAGVYCNTLLEYDKRR